LVIKHSAECVQFINDAHFHILIPTCIIYIRGHLSLLTGSERWHDMSGLMFNQTPQKSFHRDWHCRANAPTIWRQLQEFSTRGRHRKHIP